MQKELERNEMIEWCSFLTGHTKARFEKLTFEELSSEHKKIMNDTSDKMTKAE
jgi:hypothetical protein